MRGYSTVVARWIEALSGVLEDKRAYGGVQSVTAGGRASRISTLLAACRDPSDLREPVHLHCRTSRSDSVDDGFGTYASSRNKRQLTEPLLGLPEPDHLKVVASHWRATDRPQSPASHARALAGTVEDSEEAVTPHGHRSAQPDRQ